jgi:hypothetical protein
MHTCAAILSQISGDVDDANQFIYFLILRTVSINFLILRTVSIIV